MSEAASMISCAHDAWHRFSIGSIRLLLSSSRRLFYQKKHGVLRDGTVQELGQRKCLRVDDEPFVSEHVLAAVTDPHKIDHKHNRSHTIAYKNRYN